MIQYLSIHTCRYCSDFETPYPIIRLDLFGGDQQDHCTVHAAPFPILIMILAMILIMILIMIPIIIVAATNRSTLFIASMYGIFTYIYHEIQLNEGKYIIHGVG